MAKIIDIIKNAGEVDVTAGIVEEVVKAVPEIQFFDAATIRGTTVSTLARTSLPTVAFRSIGDPVSASRSAFAKRTAELKMLSGRAEISDAEITANPLMTKDEQCVDEAVATLTAAFKALARQLWYGTGADAKGFAGADALVDAAMVTKAGAGDAADTNTSVWFVGNDAKTECGLLFSENSKLLSATDVEFRHGDIAIKTKQKKTVAVGDSSAEVEFEAVTGVEPGWIGDLTSWAAFHLANKHRLARLCNVTATTGLTDGMLRDCIEAYAQLNDGVMPKAIFMSYGARKMLRKSRTLTLAIKNGANAVVEAPTVVDVDGIPVIATNALLDTEAKVA